MAEFKYEHETHTYKFEINQDEISVLNKINGDEDWWGLSEDEVEKIEYDGFNPEYENWFLLDLSPDKYNYLGILVFNDDYYLYNRYYFEFKGKNYCPPVYEGESDGDREIWFQVIQSISNENKVYILVHSYYNGDERTEYVLVYENGKEKMMWKLVKYNQFDFKLLPERNYVSYINFVIFDMKVEFNDL